MYLFNLFSFLPKKNVTIKRNKELKIIVKDCLAKIRKVFKRVDIG